MRFGTLFCLIFLFAMPSYTLASAFSESLIFKIQNRLKLLGHYSGPLDSKWGWASKRALKSWELENKLAPDGEVSADDLKLLLFTPANPTFPTDFTEIDAYQNQRRIIAIRYPSDKKRLNEPVDGLAFHLDLQNPTARLRLSYIASYNMPLTLNGKPINHITEYTTEKGLRELFADLGANDNLRNRVREICRIIGEGMFFYAVQDDLRKTQTVQNASTIDVLFSKKDQFKKISENCMSALTDNTNENDSKISDLETKVKKYRDQISEQSEQIASLNSRIAKQKATISKLQNTTEDSKISELERQVIDYNEQLEEQSEQIASLNSRIAKQKATISNLQKTFNEEKSRKVKIEEDLKKQLSKVKELETEIQTLVESANKNNSEASIEVDDLKKELSSLKTALSATEKELTKTQESKAANVKALKELEAKNEIISNQLAEAEAQITFFKSGETIETRNWKDVETSLSLQQQRFCDILTDFRKEFVKSMSSLNQIKVNRTIMDRDENIDALIPNGKFDNWLGKIVEIYQTPELDAGYTIELQCGAKFSTGQIDIDGNKKWVATAPNGGRIFNQLADLSAGQFVMVSGSMIKYADISKQKQSATYITKYEGDGTWTEWEQFFSNSTEKKDSTVKLLDTENTDFMFFADMNYLSQY